MELCQRVHTEAIAHHVKPQEVLHHGNPAGPNILPFMIESAILLPNISETVDNFSMYLGSKYTLRNFEQPNMLNSKFGQ